MKWNIVGRPFILFKRAAGIYVRSVKTTILFFKKVLECEAIPRKNKNVTDLERFGRCVMMRQCYCYVVFFFPEQLSPEELMPLRFHDLDSFLYNKFFFYYLRMSCRESYRC